MTYEFNPNSQRFEARNPHRVENLFLLAGGGALIISGLAGLFAARNHIASSGMQHGGGVVIGALVFAAGLVVIACILSQLKFYFGREQPSSFDRNVPTDTPVEAAHTAEHVRCWIRQNAINYPIPQSGIDQLLYTLIPNLVFSPWPLQLVARAQFHNVLVFAAVAISAVIALLGITTNVGGWIAMAYFAIALFMVLRTWSKSSQKGLELSIGQAVALAVTSIVGPILLSLSNIGAAPFAEVVAWVWQAALAVGSTALVAGLLLWAVTKHVVVPNTLSMSNNVQKVSFNGNPDQLYVELDRQLQANWTEQIPNRKYFRHEPSIQGEKGNFTGEVMEETQPVPETKTELTLKDCWNSAEYRPLILLDCVMLILLLTTAVSGYLAAAANSVNVNTLLTGAVSWCVAMFAFRSSRSLWRRFRFTSRIYWVEIQGNFQQANVDFGNVLHDRLKTRKSVTNIEDMTLRTWVAALDSICYGRDGYRWVVGFAGLPQVANDLGNALATHLREGSIIVAPTSASDLQRAHQVVALNSGTPKTSEHSSSAALLATQLGESDTPRSEG